MARHAFGKTWWGAQWLNALHGIDLDNRLPRGRRYANNGSIKDLHVRDGTVQAKVQGSRPRPYNVDLNVPAMADEHARQLIDAIAGDPVLIARLLNRELDPAVLDRAEALGVPVFPARWADLSMDCSCPDFAVPCKHLAAVVYTLSREIDGDPFAVFRLRGVDLLAELEQRGITIAAETQAAPPPLEDLILTGSGADAEYGDEHAEPGVQDNAESLAGIDYTGLPDLSQALPRALPPNPPIGTGKDFRDIWTARIAKIAREARKRLERPEAASPAPHGRNLTADDCPTLLIDAHGDVGVSGVQGIETLGGLLPLLARLQPDDLPDVQPQTAALHAVHKAALHLLAAGAAVPSVFAVPRGETGLLWLPATLDGTVRALIRRLAEGLPEDLLRYRRGRQRRRLAPEVQARLLCGLFMDRYIRAWQVLAAREDQDKAVALFFGAGRQRFDGPGEGAVPGSILTWLSRLHLSEREHTPVLQLEEINGEAFALSLAVAPAKETTAEPPVPLAAVLREDRWASKRNSVLQTLSMLADAYPAISGYISAGAWEPLRVPPEALPDLLFEVFPVLRLLGIRTLLPRALERLLRPRPSMAMTATAPDAGGHLNAGDLFDFNWRVAVGDALLTPEEFESLVADATGVVRFRGAYVYLDPGEVERLRRQLAEPPKVSGAERTRIALTGTYEGVPVGLDDSAMARLDALRANGDAPPPSALTAELRPYQERGFQWLYRNAQTGFGSVLADDMGLGKTLQVIAALLKLKDEGELAESGALVIVPTSLLTNWRKEIERFAPSLTFALYHGPARKLPKSAQPDVLLTTYGVARSDAAHLRRLNWRVVVVDEAQNIKNPSAAQTKAVKSIQAGAQIAMSGTPVENRLSEYWSIMDFANPGYLGPVKRFTQEFGTPIQAHGDREAVERFRRATAPFLMRRLKTDKTIIDDLPDKIEQDQICGLTKAQIALYESVVREGMEVIEGTSDTFKRQGMVLQMILTLKQICNHPAQYLKRGETAANQSGKAERLLELLAEIHDRHEKVLVFTQFREAGDLLQRWIADAFGRAPQFLHGGLSRKRRDAMVERFQNDRTERVFLLSLKAAGTGLNLTAASQVIHFDLWWNPAVENQATDRAYRIGQEQTVQVHRLITRNTFEERINDMIRSKRELSDLTVATGEQWIGNLSDSDLKEVFTLAKGGR